MHLGNQEYERYYVCDVCGESCDFAESDQAAAEARDVVYARLEKSGVEINQKIKEGIFIGQREPGQFIPLSGEVNAFSADSFKKKTAKDYKPETCACCNQTTTYLIPIDRGTVEIVKSIANAVRRKGINIVHPRKEMEISSENHNLYSDGFLTSNQVGNLSRPRMHGLIAKVKGNPGNYCLTRKGAQFLKGVEIPRFAIISKAEGHQIGYWQPETKTVNVRSFDKKGEAYWNGIDFEIQEGHIVTDLK